MPKTHVRVLGGGNTFVEIGLGKTYKVEFLAQLQDTPGRVKGGPVEIQGIGDPYPVEIATGYSQGMGTLTLTVWQTWGEDGWVSAFKTRTNDGSYSDVGGVWSAFLNSSGEKHNSDDGYPVDLYEVLKAQRMNSDFIHVLKFERGADGSIARVKSYEGCVITDIQGTESVRNESMDNPVTITMNYTHVTVVKPQEVANISTGLSS